MGKISWPSRIHGDVIWREVVVALQAWSMSKIVHVFSSYEFSLLKNRFCFTSSKPARLSREKKGLFFFAEFIGNPFTHVYRLLLRLSVLRARVIWQNFVNNHPEQILLKPISLFSIHCKQTYRYTIMRKLTGTFYNFWTHHSSYNTVLFRCQGFHFSLDLYTIGTTSLMGDQPVARPLPTHRSTQTQNKPTNTHTDTKTSMA
jgi:hypothetical protein